jgi:hypothetical protein
MEQINNNGYQMFLDTDSVFAPREQGLERQAKQNALARQQSVRNALAQSINPQTGLTNYEFAQQIGGVDLAPELQAARQADALRQEEFLGKQATNRKLGAEANIKENELMISHLQTMGGLIGAAIDQDSYTNNVRQAAAMGYNISELPENFDAKYVANLRQRALTAEQQLKQQNEAATLAATKARDLATAANQRGTLSVAQRNAAVNEAAERRQAASGASAPKPKDATVSEQQAAYHGKRILDAAAQIAAAAKKAPSANRPSALEATVSATPGVRNIVGAVRSAPRQIVTAAQREMLDALLYLATGAAYNKEQLEGEIESTLPAYLDKPETVKAKRDRLRLKIDAAKIRAGDAWTPEMDAALAVLDADAAGSSTAPAASSAPAGVDAAIWNVMTPEERALWQK